MNKESSPLLSTANQVLAEFIPILTGSYHPVTKLVNNKYRIQEKVITVPEKTFFLVLLYLGLLALQTRTKLRKSLKSILNCCKLQIVFRSQNKLAKTFNFKDRIPKELTSGVV